MSHATRRIHIDYQSGHNSQSMEENPITIGKEERRGEEEEVRCHMLLVVYISTISQVFFLYSSSVLELST